MWPLVGNLAEVAKTLKKLLVFQCFLLPRPSNFEAKLTKNLSESFPEAFSKVIIFLIGCGIGFVAIWCQLGSNLAAKTVPKSTQVGPQVDQNLHQDADNFFP